MTTPDPRLGAVILTGGSGVRLGGVDKASIEIDGSTLLEHALAATASAAEVVVVGPEVPTSRPVTWTREEPPGGGPAAGLLAGLGRLMMRPELVCVLAVDLPRFTARTTARLLDVLDEVGTAGPALPDGACLADGTGRRQWLAGVYRLASLEAAAPDSSEAWHGLPVGRLMMPLRLLDVAAVGDEGRDVDTWEDLRHVRG